MSHFGKVKKVTKNPIKGIKGDKKISVFFLVFLSIFSFFHTLRLNTQENKVLVSEKISQSLPQKGKNIHLSPKLSIITYLDLRYPQSEPS